MYRWRVASPHRVSIQLSHLAIVVVENDTTTKHAQDAEGADAHKE